MSWHSFLWPASMATLSSYLKTRKTWVVHSIQWHQTLVLRLFLVLVLVTELQLGIFNEDKPVLTSNSVFVSEFRLSKVSDLTRFAPETVLCVSSVGVLSFINNLIGNVPFRLFLIVSAYLFMITSDHLITIQVICNFTLYNVVLCLAGKSSVFCFVRNTASIKNLPGSRLNSLNQLVLSIMPSLIN